MSLGSLPSHARSMHPRSLGLLLYLCHLIIPDCTPVGGCVLVATMTVTTSMENRYLDFGGERVILGREMSHQGRATQVSDKSEGAPAPPSLGCCRGRAPLITSALCLFGCSLTDTNKTHSIDRHGSCKHHGCGRRCPGLPLHP